MSNQEKKAFSYKEICILLAWTLGVLLILSLMWFLSQGLRDRQLARTVNKILSTQKSAYRLGEPLPSGGRPGGVVQLSRKFKIIDKQETGIVFVFIYRGIPASCLAVLGESGDTNEIIPLSKHGELMLERIPRETLRLYLRRIEAAVMEVK